MKITRPRSKSPAGTSARRMAVPRLALQLVAVIAVVIVTWVFVRNIHNLTAVSIGAVIAGIIVFRLGLEMIGSVGKKAKRRAKDALQGAAGERAVGVELEKLPVGHQVFHDLVFQGFNIDHVAVGPGGIFVIETKSHRGKVEAAGDVLLLNGKPTEKNFISQSWRQTYALRDLLKEKTGDDWPVIPILCFSHAFVSTRQTVKGVAVVYAQSLSAHIERAPVKLSTEAVVQAVRAIEALTVSAS